MLLSFADDDIFVHTQAADGTVHDNWGVIPIRVTDLAITPDLTRLVTVGMYSHPSLLPVRDASQPAWNNGDTASPNSGVPVNGPNHRMIVYDLMTKQVESYVEL
jgi:hypothetical protein